MKNFSSCSFENVGPRLGNPHRPWMTRSKTAIFVAKQGSLDDSGFGFGQPWVSDHITGAISCGAVCSYPLLSQCTTPGAGGSWGHISCLSTYIRSRFGHGLPLISSPVPCLKASRYFFRSPFSQNSWLLWCHSYQHVFFTWIIMKGSFSTQIPYILTRFGWLIFFMISISCSKFWKTQVICQNHVLSNSTSFSLLYL